MAKKLVWSLLLIQAAVYSECSHYSCFTGATDIQAYPLPNEASARYLQPFNRSQARQVIVPRMSFSCAGYITGWSAHTLVVTRPFFLDVLTHIITFQVWRPDPTNRSYSLVGANELAFSGTSIRNNITEIPGRTETAFFSFEREVEQSEQIYVLPGDVIGWSIPSISTISPLSPLFRDPTPQDCDDRVVDMWYRNSAQQECTMCDYREGSDTVSSKVPLMAVSFNTFSPDNTCVQSDRVCSATTPPDSTTPPPTETTPTTARPTSNTLNQRQPLGGSVTTAELICIILAALTFIFHIIMIVLCAANLAVMKQIRAAMPSRTAPSDMPSPTNFTLKSPLKSPHKVKDITPSNYDAVMPSHNGYETVPPTSTEIFPFSDTDRMGSPSSLNKHMVNSKGGSVASINKLSDSRTGSTQDLLRVKPLKEDLV